MGDENSFRGVWYREPAKYGSDFSEFALDVSEEDSRISGKGQDITGEFRVRGELSGDRIVFAKEYVGMRVSHTVKYSGKAVEDGSYRGTFGRNGDIEGRFILVPGEVRGDLRRELENLELDARTEIYTHRKKVEAGEIVEEDF